MMTTKLDRFREAERLTLDEVLAEIEAEEEDYVKPTPEAIEVYCQECDGFNLPCLYRQTWRSSDGLVKHCPELGRIYGGRR